MNDALEHVVVEGLDEVGYDLVELRQGGTRSRPVLEVRIDRRDGEKVTVDDCARASRALEARLDASALVAERYVLQVSSPGERPLRTPAEWRRFVGRWANVLAPEFGGRFEGEIVRCGRGGWRGGRHAATGAWGGEADSARRGQGGAAGVSLLTSQSARVAGIGEPFSARSWMVSSAEMLAAFRELSNSKQLDRTELYGLLQDGIHGRAGEEVRPHRAGRSRDRRRQGRDQHRAPEDGRRDGRGLRPARSPLEEAKIFDEGFEPGDVMEEPLDFTVFGRAAIQAAKQRIIQRVREGERTKIRDEFASRVGDLLSGEIQQIERGKLVVMLNKFREAEAIIPYREQNHREHFHQGEPIRAVLKRVEETPKGPRLILSRADGLFVKALFKLEVPEIQQNIVEIRADGPRSRQPHEDRRLLARRLASIRSARASASRARACRRS